VEWIIKAQARLWRGQFFKEAVSKGAASFFVLNFLDGLIHKGIV